MKMKINGIKVCAWKFIKKPTSGIIISVHTSHFMLNVPQIHNIQYDSIANNE